MEKIERFKRGIAAMSADEREALHNALAAAVALENPVERSDLVDYITDIGAAKGRTLARREAGASFGRPPCMAALRIWADNIRPYGHGG